MFPKPEKRTKDAELMRALHLEYLGEPCELCERRPGAELHHKRSRAQGGDDSRENLMWLCASCHADVHAGRYAFPR